MLNSKVNDIYIRSKASIMLNDEKISITDISNLLIDNISLENIFGYIMEIIKVAPHQRGFDLVNDLINKKPELEKTLFNAKLSTLVWLEKWDQMESFIKGYELKFNRDQDSIIALLQFYLQDGFHKNVDKIDNLNKQLETFLEH